MHFLRVRYKEGVKYFYFFLIFRLSLSSSHFQRIKLIKLLLAEYKNKLIRITVVTIHMQLTVSIVLWIFMTVPLKRILFKTYSVIIYCHNQLKSLSWIDFSCVFKVSLRSLIHNASPIFCFHLLLWKFLSITIINMLYNILAYNNFTLTKK